MFVFLSIEAVLKMHPANLHVRNGKHPVLKVVLLGDGSVGKTSLMNRFVSNKFDSESYHTIGVDFLSKDLTVDKDTFALQIWDTAGQERFKSLRTPFYRGADCCMLTFSVDDRQSFSNVPLWREEFLKYADVKDDIRFPFLVIGNKIDLPERKIKTEEAEAWCKLHSMLYFETSAKDAVNVDKAFIAAVQKIQELEQYLDSTRSIPRSDTADLSRASVQSSKCC